LTVGNTNDVQDIILENVQVKRAVPNQAPTKIGVSIRAAGYHGLAVPVQILHANRVVASQELKLKEGPQSIELDFIPRERGFQVYEVKIPVQSGEWLATNNRRLFGLEVLDPTIRVIYMEGTPQPGSPIPEWKYQKDALNQMPISKSKRCIDIWCERAFHRRWIRNRRASIRWNIPPKASAHNGG
jgi:hypothetical protein